MIALRPPLILPRKRLLLPRIQPKLLNLVRRTPNGPLLRNPSGALAGNLNCCCVSCACCDAGTASYLYDLIVAGVVNGTCADCAALNATHVLTNDGGCTWVKLFSLCGKSWRMELAITCPGDYLVYDLGITYPGGGNHVYTLQTAVGDTDCSLSRTLAVVSHADSLCDWSAVNTVVIEPS
jgi:hypothetical protein